VAKAAGDDGGGRSLGGRLDFNDAAICDQGTSLMAPDPEAAQHYAEACATFRAIQGPLRTYDHDAARKVGSGT